MHYLAAIRIADETGNKQNQHEARFGLALANLFAGELTAAREAFSQGLAEANGLLE